MEKFLDNQAEPKHDDMKKRLILHDEKINSYHQVCISKNLQQENNTSELLSSLLWKQSKNGPPCSNNLSQDWYHPCTAIFKHYVFI